MRGIKERLLRRHRFRILGSLALRRNSRGGRFRFRFGGSYIILSARILQTSRPFAFDTMRRDHNLSSFRRFISRLRYKHFLRHSHLFFKLLRTILAEQFCNSSCVSIFTHRHRASVSCGCRRRHRKWRFENPICPPPGSDERPA